MKRALVVLETDEDGRTLPVKQANSPPDRSPRRLALMAADEYAEKQEMLEAAGKGEHTTYDERAVLDNLTQNSEEVVESTFDGLDWTGTSSRPESATTKARPTASWRPPRTTRWTTYSSLGRSALPRARRCSATAPRPSFSTSTGL